MTIFFIRRRKIKTGTLAIIMIAMLSVLLIFGVATLGLLSATFVVAPTIALYLMLLGHRKTAYLSIAAITVYLLVMAALSVSGAVDTVASPELYLRSPIAWIMMIVVVAGISITFVAPLELVPGALEGIEERFRLAFENANVGMCLTSLDGRFLKVNNALCEILGYNREELEQMNIGDITQEDDRETSSASLMQQQNGGKEKINVEQRYVHKLGNIVLVSISSSLIRNSQHAPQYFITHIQNITERKHGEDNLQQALAWQEAIFEGSRDSVFISDQNSRFVAVNTAACDLTGYTREQLLGMRIPDLHDEADLTAYKTNNQKILNGEEIVDEAKILRPDGTKVYAEFNNKRVSIGGALYMHTTARDITGRKAAEAALVASETKFRSIFENIHDVYFETSLDGTILEISPSVEILSKGQYTRDDVLNKSFVAFYHEPAARDRFLASLKESNQLSDYEIILKNRDASVIECSISAKLQKKPDDDNLIISGTIRDISDRKRTEHAVRENEERFRSIYENSTLGLYRTTPQGKIVLANATLVKKLGYSSFEELAKRDLEEEGFEPSYERKRFIEQVEATGAVNGLESAWTRADGTVIHVRESVRAFRDAAGRTLYYDGTVEDITERKEAEMALRASETQFREIWESTVEGIVIHDHGVIQELNHAMCQMFGYTREEALGKSLLDFAPPEAHDVLRRHISSNDKDRLDLSVTRFNGTRLYMEVFSKSIVYRGKKLRMAAVRDITERKQVEDALRNSEERYQRITAAITDYIYTVRLLKGRRVLETRMVSGCVNVTGYQPDEFQTDPFLWFNMVSPRTDRRWKNRPG